MRVHGGNFRLDQIPKVATDVFEHGDSTEGFFNRVSNEDDAFRTTAL